MTTSKKAEAIDNGVNTDHLLGARGEIEEEPAKALFTWRATCEWRYGTHAVTKISDFFGFEAEQPRNKTFAVDTDHPMLFAAEDNGATPIEIVLVGLAGCLTGGLAAIAQHRGIQLRSVTSHLEGTQDLQGVLGVDEDVRNGFGGIRVSYEIDADASREDLEALVAQAQKRSAVFDILVNPTNVQIKLAAPAQSDGG